MLANPLLSPEPAPGAFYGSTDRYSTIETAARQPMNDSHLIGGVATDATTPVIGSGRTNVYVGVLVLFALAGIVAFHFGGFDAHLFVGKRS